jgi:hypothetical protein
VIDTDVINPDNPAYIARRRYFACGQELQGLSAGWGDHYKSFLDGQSITLKGIVDGIYALKSSANPGAILLESNYSNNAALVYLEIRGNSLTIIQKPEIIEKRCLETGWC